MKTGKAPYNIPLYFIHTNVLLRYDLFIDKCVSFIVGYFEFLLNIPFLMKSIANCINCMDRCHKIVMIWYYMGFLELQIVNRKSQTCKTSLVDLEIECWYDSAQCIYTYQ